jgi:DNA-binding NtrC family response regulator
MSEVLNPKIPILIVDDEVSLLQSFDLTLGDAGINNIINCNDSREVFHILSQQDVEIILLDLSMPYIGGEDLLPQITEEYPGIPIIIITGLNKIETAVSCMKKGAYDYIVKPVSDERLVDSIKKAMELKALKDENRLLKQHLFSLELENPEAFKRIVTGNEKILSIFRYMEAIAKTSEPVLITGETGVGKELIADAFHKLSNREGKFVAINVAGLDDQMFTDTLFGHKKGAFTDAIKERSGLIEHAAGGTLFLDEIGDLSIPSQVKLLRLLQEQEYYMLGEDEPKYSDVLVIVSTNQNLYKMQEKGAFRKDLFYRLNVHQIHMPPLRESLGDLPILVSHFLEEASRALEKKKPTPPPELFTLLMTYHFPGNIRELRALVYDAVSTHKSKILSLETFEKAIKKSREGTQNALPREEIGEESSLNQPIITFSHQFPTLKQTQMLLIQEALTRAKNNQSIAAQLLGITRQALSRRLKGDKFKKSNN